MESNRQSNTSLVSIFTYDKNWWLLKDLLHTIPQDFPMTLLVIDFSEDPGEIRELVGDRGIVISHKRGFCDNFNLSRMIAIVGNYSWYFCLNDDIRLHDNFFYNALSRLQDMSIGFLGGTSQVGGWLEEPDNAIIPIPIDKVHELDNISRLHWEFSACVIPVDVMKCVGPMDVMFSPKLGLCADNDYLHRIRQLGFRTIRDDNVTFWHSKARTQSEFRCPWGKDPHRQRAVKYMKLKWGCDINDPEVRLAQFELPFNGKAVTIKDENIIIIDGREYDLEGE